MMWKRKQYKLSFILSVILVSGCAIPERALSGFTVTPDFPNEFVEELVPKSIKKDICDGTLIKIEHTNGRALSLFTPYHVDELKEFRRILQIIKDGNNPEKWPFEYCIFDEVVINEQEDEELKFEKSRIIPGSRKPEIDKQIEISGYKIGYTQIENFELLKIKVDVQQVNGFNFFNRIQDGPKLRNKSQHSFYVLDGSLGDIEILLLDWQWGE